MLRPGTGSVGRGGGGAKSTASRRSSASASKKVPLIEERFSQESEKHTKWSVLALIWTNDFSRDL